MTSKRTIAAANETALLSQVVKIVYYARMDFSSGVQRFHTEIGPKTATHPIHGAESYLGIGDFGGVTGQIVEATSGSPQAIRLTLTGVDSAWINRALVDDYYRRDVEVMLGLEDGDGVPVADPEILFSGFMDKVDVSLGEGSGQMLLTCESRATLLRRASDWRFTDEDKQIEVNGDLLGEYIYRMADLQLYWGNREVSVGGNYAVSPVGNDFDKARNFHAR
jgi:hypothetical protein